MRATADAEAVDGGSQTRQIDFTQPRLRRHGALFRRGAKPAHRFDETLQHTLTEFIQLSQAQLPGDIAGFRQFAKHDRGVGKTIIRKGALGALYVDSRLEENALDKTERTLNESPSYGSRIAVDVVRRMPSTK